LIATTTVAESHYVDKEGISTGVAAGQHRQLIGGLWEELGALQFDFLLAHGLKPEHTLIDIGCGCLRAGVRIVPYVNPGNYVGIDSNRSLLEAGYKKEIIPLGLASRLPRSNLVEMDDFSFESLGRRFDFALAQSVFSHLTFNHIRQCLENLPIAMRSGAVFFATFFESPDDRPSGQTILHKPGDVTTNDSRDPYHYKLADMLHAIRGLPWKLEYVGDWGHPRGQRMLAFIAN